MATGNDNDFAKLQYNGQEFDLPLHMGSEGEAAIDVSKLRTQAGLVTLDNGFGNTAACRSAITYIDGEKGILRYRGYDIEDLARNSSFVETAHLLLYGELPDIEQRDNFSRLLNRSSLIHEDMHHFFNAYPKTAHPMGILSSMVASLSAFYPVDEVMDDAQEREVLANLISQIRTLAAFSYKKSIGEPIVYPSCNMRYVNNFLNMMFSSPVNDYEVDPEIARAIEVFLVLHADHEQNCSTSSVRMSGSSLANVYAVISSGIGALWGSRHGGANQAVIEMLSRIHAQKGDGSEFIKRAKDKNSGERLMGFGHRVYKQYDPRAKILKKICHKVLDRPGISDPLFDIALRLEETALTDDYFIERNLYPNVDFYSGLILKAAGIPQNMFTVLFTIGRMPGWLAHWREMHNDKDFRISRPRQLYVGATQRKVKPLVERQAASEI